MAETELTVPLASYSILVVEDNKDIRDLVAHILKSSGFQVTTATESTGALVEIDRHKPDLVLLDVMLPGISGLDLLRKIRSSESEVVRQIAVIMMSAKSQHSDVAAGMALGATDYVVKPFRPAELMERITAVVARRASAPGTA